MQALIDATQKKTAIDQQQHSCETLICQCHQTILRLLSSATTASTWWWVRELYCPTTYSYNYSWHFLKPLDCMSKSPCTIKRQHVHKCHGGKALLSHNVKAFKFLAG